MTRRVASADVEGELSPRLLELLACPACGTALTEVERSRLQCSTCGASYPVSGGVPRMIRGPLPDDLAQTADNFGWQWHAFTEQHREFREELLEWLNPLEPSDFVGKRVLDAGCGKGRHVLLADEFGAAHIVGLDLSSAVDVARRQTAHRRTIDIVQGNLLEPPLAEGAFDLIYSIGVIHHVPEPARAIQSLALRLRPGGTLHVWVYGYEGNAIVRSFVDPVRKQLTRHVSRGLVRVGSLPPAAILAGLGRLARLGRIPLLPYQPYLRRLGGYSIPHIWTIVYDQLMAPTTHYVKGPEIEAWFRAAGLMNVRLRDSRGMSWAATAQRP